MCYARAPCLALHSRIVPAASDLKLDASLIAWVSQTYRTANGVLIAMAIVGVAVLTAFVIRLNRLAYRRIRELENL